MRTRAQWAPLISGAKSIWFFSDFLRKLGIWTFATINLFVVLWLPIDNFEKKTEKLEKKKENRCFCILFGLKGVLQTHKFVFQFHIPPQFLVYMIFKKKDEKSGKISRIPERKCYNWDNLQFVLIFYAVPIKRKTFFFRFWRIKKFSTLEK